MVTLFAVLVLLGLLVWAAVVIKKLKRINDKLSAANRANLPYAAAEEIEDTIACLNMLGRELDFKRDLIENAKAHAKLARQNKRAGRE